MDNQLYPLQIAILGSAGDIASVAETALAAELAAILVKGGATVLVGGDDGVMGAAAEAAKLAGGTVTCVLAAQKTLTHRAAAFDTVIRTYLPYGPAAAPLIASADAAVIIGGGVGSLLEIAQGALFDTPMAALYPSEAVGRLCGEWLDQRQFSRVKVVSDPQQAARFALEAGFRHRFGAEVLPEQLARLSDEVLHTAYPYGDDSRLTYRKAAHARQLAAAMSERGEDVARARLLNADFAYYRRALEHAFGHAANAASTAGVDPYDRAFAQAFACESAGYTLGELDLHSEAAVLLRAAARGYHAMQAAAGSDDERRLLRHSAAGCLASAACNEAYVHARQGRAAMALRRIAVAERLVARAARLNPRWNDNSTHDVRAHAEAEIAAARAVIKACPE